MAKYKELKYPQLKSLASKRGLNATGKTEDIVRRLVEDDAKSGEATADLDVNDVRVEEIKSKRVFLVKQNQRQVMMSLTSHKDRARNSYITKPQKDRKRTWISNQKSTFLSHLKMVKTQNKGKRSLWL